MICKLHGVLETVTASGAHLTVADGLTYEVLLASYAIGRLAGRVGEAITLHTVQYLEGAAQGNVMTPRLIGFVAEADREFFRLFTSVKGIGPRKALRAMAWPVGQIAAAIAERDVKTLQSLPEIGRRTAEGIVAELHGRVDAFIDTAAYGGGEVGEPAASPPRRAAAREALDVLLQLGENRTQALRWIDEALTRQPDLDDAEQLVSDVLRAKSGP